MMSLAAQRREVEGLLRDVASTLGVLVSAVRAVRTADGWVVSVIDTHDRLFSTVIAHGPPTVLRDILTRWLQREG
jgi:hypothetical protein